LETSPSFISNHWNFQDMKFVVIVGDGMGDYPIAELGNRTPLQAARMPNVRGLASVGKIDAIVTVPEPLSTGSDVANLGLMGYDPHVHYSGRAPIEAVGNGLPLADDDVAFRCNVVTTDGERMIDYSAGHIETQDAHAFIATVDQRLGKAGVRFYGGVSYRHLLLWRNGPADGLKTTAPHDITDQPMAAYLPNGPRADEVNAMMEASKEILCDHPVNKARRAAGKREVSQIWLWGQGRGLKLQSYREKFGLSGVVISAVDLVRGLGVLAGLDAPRIQGATGFLDTNYSGKVDAALTALREKNFAYVHIEAPDECGHLGDAKKKVLAIEQFDERVVGPIWREMEARREPYRLIVAMDHRTPCARRSHSREPVPILTINGPTGPLSRQSAFDEETILNATAVLSYDWMRRALRA
jgi:2,3-bisphosphoglycerate-independent phosphoglycerate mutase